MGPRRGPGKDAIKRPHDVAWGVGGGLQDAVPPVPESFAEGVEAERARRRMDPAYGDAYGLGEYVEPRGDAAVHI